MRALAAEAKYVGPTETMPDYVAYHSASIMGHPFEAGERFAFASSKPESELRRAFGSPVWVIASTRVGDKTSYFLAGVFTPSELTAAENGWTVSGDGSRFDPSIEVTELAWFQELRREQANFSLGFSRIRSQSIASALDQIRASHPSRFLNALEGQSTRIVANRYEREPSFNQAETFTMIARAIIKTPGDQDGFVTHGSIVSAVLLDATGAEVVSRARALSSWPDDKSCASNMVAWFSQQITIGHSPWADFFDRERRESTWAYRPKTAVHPPIAADLELSAVEGEPRLFFHLRRERDPAIAEAKSVLCPNCHRAIHRTSPVMAVEEFRRMLFPHADPEAG